MKNKYTENKQKTICNKCKLPIFPGDTVYQEKTCIPCKIKQDKTTQKHHSERGYRKWFYTPGSEQWLKQIKKALQHKGFNFTPSTREPNRKIFDFEEIETRSDKLMNKAILFLQEYKQ